MDKGKDGPGPPFPSILVQSLWDRMAVDILILATRRLAAITRRRPALQYVEVFIRRFARLIRRRAAVCAGNGVAPARPDNVRGAIREARNPEVVAGKWNGATAELFPVAVGSQLADLPRL